MLSLQRMAAEAGDLVCEGRDMGSVVFPRAGLKVSLAADGGVRAERRRKELEERGESLTRDELVARLQDRDRQDATRTNAPLKRIEGQVLVDTSDLTIDGVVERLVELVSAQK
jgi:cytidylate kinase